MSNEFIIITFLATQGFIIPALFLIFYRQGLIMAGVKTADEHINIIFSRLTDLEKKVKQ